MPRDRRSASTSASSSFAYRQKRAPPAAGPRWVEWTAMIALSPHFSSETKWISSCASKSGRPQGVVMTCECPVLEREEKMGRSRGLEPPTLGTTNRCSNQLSYDRHDLKERFPWPRAPLRVLLQGTQERPHA